MVRKDITVLFRAFLNVHDINVLLKELSQLRGINYFWEKKLSWRFDRDQHNQNHLYSFLSLKCITTNGISGCLPILVLNLYNIVRNIRTWTFGEEIC